MGWRSWILNERRCGCVPASQGWWPPARMAAVSLISTYSRRPCRRRGKIKIKIKKMRVHRAAHPRERSRVHIFWQPDLRRGGRGGTVLLALLQALYDGLDVGPVGERVRERVEARQQSVRAQRYVTRARLARAWRRQRLIIVPLLFHFLDAVQLPHFLRACASVRRNTHPRGHQKSHLENTAASGQRDVQFLQLLGRDG